MTRLEIVSDVVCPWCYLGAANLLQRCTARGAEPVRPAPGARSGSTRRSRPRASTAPPTWRAKFGDPARLDASPRPARGDGPRRRPRLPLRPDPPRAELARRPPADPLGRGRGPADPHRDGALLPLLRARRGHLRPGGAARRRRGGRPRRRRRRAAARRRRRPRRGRGRGARAQPRSASPASRPSSSAAATRSPAPSRPSLWTRLADEIDDGGRRHEPALRPRPAAARSSPAPARASASRSPRASPPTARRVVLNGRDPGRLAAAAAAIPGAATAAFDVTDPAAVAAGVAGIEADLGPIDILVNNAGMQFRAPLEDFPHDKWAAAPRHQRLERLLRRPGGGAAHDPPRPRQDHQHRLGPDRARPPRHRALHRHQGRDPQPDPRHGHRLGAARPAGQRHRPRLLPHPAEPGAGRRPGLLRLARDSAPRPGAGARSASSSAPPSSSPPTPPPSSTATRSTSTAASPRASDRLRLGQHPQRPGPQRVLVLEIRLRRAHEAGDRHPPAPLGIAERPAAARLQLGPEPLPTRKCSASPTKKAKAAVEQVAPAAEQPVDRTVPSGANTSA